NVATDLSRPVGELIGAVEKVREGDLTARVRELPHDDEIGLLSSAFNRMTDQLSDQRRELVQTNRQLDERRQFTETVLAGVSAGVIGLDRKGNINLPNLSAARLLGLDVEDLVGKPLIDVVPEIGALLGEARKRRFEPIEAQVKITRNGEVRTLLVAVAAEQIKGKTIGYVVTFDDVSALLEAQWKGAWADVARRIAHEIRNPLTPIQLSAERLKRKYLNEITSDRETFVVCTDTIVRQVDDIGRMIEEFSNFARMPAPVLRLENLNELCRQVIFLQRNGHPEIDFIAVMPEDPVYATCDGRQMGQVVTNLVQNAAESMDRRKGGEDGPRVILRLQEEDGRAVVEVEDNGPGLPVEGRDKLIEPYVTTRKKGTGLGLAIVRKILEDHGGSLILGDAEGGGALVRAEFARDAGPAGKRRPKRTAKEEPVTHGS
ncbi:MAG: ATP-binding protein, partial [Pseudomonadota bacterium]